MSAAAPAVRITDTTLRDGSHAVRHMFTLEQVRAVSRALDAAGVPIIEVTHGDGLSGSSFNYGFSLVDEIELVAAAAAEAERARIAVLLLPGLGTVGDLRIARRAGASLARIATHCTEADVSIQHFGEARSLGMETVGFLMLSHRASPAELAVQARIMADAGCQCVYVVDSAGALLPDSAAARVRALVDELGDDAQVGFHGHQNLSLGIANSIAAYEAGARQIDGTLCGLGAGAGNSPTEILVAVFGALGVPTGVDEELILAAAEDVLRPIAARLPATDRASIVQGRYGVYNSFLLHAERAAARYGVPAYQILRRVGEAGYVGGQEDMIIDVAIELAGRAVMDAAATEALAAELLARDAQGRAGEKLTDTHPGLDEASAYRVQSRLVARRIAAGDRVVGIKLGLTSRAKQRRMGVDVPLTGVLTASMAIDPGAAREARLDIAGLIHPRVEPEIVFVMGERLSGPGLTPERALAAVASVRAGLEVIDSRFTAYGFGLADVVADNASAARFVVAPDGVAPGALDLVLEAAVLSVDGTVVDTATGAAVLGHPAAALALAANALASRGESIDEGAIVLTGGMTDAIPVSVGDRVLVEFTTLGALSLSIGGRP